MMLARYHNDLYEFVHAICDILYLIAIELLR
jgi:hypothetical protein